MIMLSQQQVNQFKDILLTRQSELIQQVQDHYGLLNEATNNVGELSSFANHPANMGTELFERGKDLALNEHMENELVKINEALHAIEEGTYGLCTKCGDTIPYERLLAVPTTDRCVEHADNQTFSNNRPIEEEVFSPNINHNELTEEEQVNYDAEDTWQELSQHGTSETPSDFFGDRDDYRDMYPNADEQIGNVEELEGFLSADLEGNFSGVTSNAVSNEEE